MILRCIAVDDEELALDIVQTYIERVPWLQLLARCGSAMEAMDVLRETHVDVLFLDIQMPVLTGMEMLRSLAHPPMVVFTTAYENYAVESYTVDAVDYLVKPFSFERFLAALRKVETLATTRTRPETVDALFVHTDRGDQRIAVGDILHIQGQSEYATLTCAHASYLLRESLRELEWRLAPLGFLRVHKSWIVNLRHVRTIDHGVMRVGDEVIPIGKMYRDSVRACIDRLRIG
ncbi:MAG TPA: response regulator transcription factor [Bacteroidota bacterium]|nr:response regulator transcription factor [Bacteroidota bacterium]